jgi:phosphate transport system protein
MRTAFRAHLAALDAEVLDLCQRVGQAIRSASQAALDGDLALAEATLSAVATIDLDAREIADSTVHLVARQQPVAQDLRALMGAQRVVTSLRRMAQLAGRVAKAARRGYPEPVVAREVVGVVSDMSGQADAITARLYRALMTHDAGAAGVLLGMSRQMTELHQEMLTIVSSAAWPYPAQTAVQVCMLSRDFERFAEHGVDVGWVIGYVATGVPRQHDICG